jgi:flavin-binding protein dodecin
MAADSGVARAAEKAADSVGAVKVAEVKEADD